MISGHPASGIEMGPTGNVDNAVKGNRIGTNAAGTAAVPNTAGITMSAPDTRSAAYPGEGNVISGNRARDLLRQRGVDHDESTIYGNLIGTTFSGTGAVPNGGRARHRRRQWAGAWADIGNTGLGQGNTSRATPATAWSSS